MPARPIPVTEANLIEIFSSIQGEGPYLGYRQLFIRFAHCNLSCTYCDTPFAPVSACRVETAPGSESFSSLKNPVSHKSIETLLEDWVGGSPDLHHSLSLTGGEPLLQVPVLLDWLPMMRNYLPIYLETNGSLPAQLKSLLPWLDYISMDIKLPSISGHELWDEHREFLGLARQKTVFVKVVFAQTTPLSEIETAARLVAETAPDVDLILQPCTQSSGIKLTTGQMLKAQQVAVTYHPKTRVIPQTHNFLGVL
ncbi:7-carboxy-7-deazaguanine synthase QueE [Geopsychrobacter electrodiphilus]|uniref:7-carboxy-7-deazaguanine synthase QueE n=1 Tax=Geopsychrobacter electrodiphilus TaxID=225196 RepID=UPI000527A210|nr:7-carboxy-7-deazaguanine synthase QueE [Geopsychrobacter electrodiphilus]